MIIEIKKTSQIEKSEWKEIVKGFNESFAPHITSIKKLVSAAEMTHIGYSFHAICYVDSKIVGFNSILPHIYNYNQKEILIGLSGSTFILQEYRQNINLLNNMLTKLKNRCKQEGMYAVVAVPNSNSYLYFKRFARFSDVGKLSYYVLPVKLNKFHKIFNNLVLKSTYNFILKMHITTNLLFSKIFRKNVMLKKISIEKSNEFLYKRFPQTSYKRYVISKEKGIIYRITSENKIDVCYLIGFYGKISWYNVISCIKSLVRSEKMDLIIFIGNFNQFQSVFFRLPRKLEPRQLPLIVFSLVSNNIFDNVIKQLDNWDFSLANLDIR
tara:strand:- start:448 stop:1422 length:975 start_codon:yes stop_codon:yes gene_type:complete